MDPLTHALSGALVVRASAREHACAGQVSVRRRMAAGCVAALFPDIDFALRLVGTLDYLAWHQGVTHSLLMLPLWALLLAGLCARIGAAPVPWQTCYPACCLGIAAHIGGDLITAYGTMLFAPLSTARYALPLAFVVDPWITAILAGGLIAGLAAAHGRHAALGALLVLTAYLGVQAEQSRRVHALAAAQAAAAQAPFGIDVLPQPFFGNWLAVLREAEGYRIARLKLHPGGLPLPARLGAIDAAYHPPQRAAWQALAPFGADPAEASFAAQAWQQPEFAGFRRFAVLPVLERVEHDAAASCAWFKDLRFELPTLTPSFRFAACRATADGSWQLRRARGALWLD